MIAQNNLDPSYVILGCFILIVLFLTGLIETAIQLFGNVSDALLLPIKPVLPIFFIFLLNLHCTDTKTKGNVSSTCSTYVTSQKVTGVSLDTLAWLEQNAICSEWDAVFAFWIIGLVFLIWMIVMASQVNNNTKGGRGSGW